jgi:diguanylate cyclase (GGDEF)-like protein/PAS domain S-box-containing protein
MPSPLLATPARPGGGFRRLHRPALWQGYLGCGAVATLAYLLVPPFKGSAPLLNCLGLSAVLAVIAGIRRNKPTYSLPWRLFALGLGLYWIGDVYTYSYPKLLHAKVPFPSVGDAVYLTVYPALMFGVLLLVRRRNPQGDRNSLLDSAILTFGLWLLSWVLLIAPYLHDPTMGFLPKLVSVAYPIGDIILLAAAIRLALDAGRHRTAFYLLGGSIVSLLVTDFVYGVLTLHQSYHHQLLLDLGWVTFQLLWGAAALHPSMVALQEPTKASEARLTPLRLSLLAGASLIAPICLLLKELRRGEVELIVIIWTSLVLSAFVVMRMIDLVRQHEQAVARERLLSSCGAALVSCASQQEMQQAALDVVAPLLEGPGAAVLCLLEDRVLAAVARNEEAGWPARTLSADMGARLLALASEDDPRGVVLEPAVLAALGLPRGWSCGLLLTLPARGDVLGLLVIACPKPASAQVRAALGALATQLTLALEGAQVTEEIHRQQSEARFASLVEHASDLITVVGSDGLITYQSPSSERVLGYQPHELLGTRFDRLAVGDDATHLLRLLADGSSDGRREGGTIECSLRHRDGRQRQFEILYTNLLADERVRGIVINSRDISERNELTHRAFHDPMTNLPNRTLFVERIHHAIVRARRGGAGPGVIFLDMDDFKAINDRFGHGAGDSALVEVAKRLSGSIRAGDTAARFGGDEFVVLLEDLEDTDTAVGVAERILADLGRPLVVAGNELVLRGSIGISILGRSSASSADELIRDADAAMYIAKRDGSGGYRLFDAEMHGEELARSWFGGTAASSPNRRG